MSVLRNIESKLESLFEGVFGRAFRTNVQPVELARKLVKEMDDHRNISVSRVYVPNEYTIYLSPGDRDQFASYQEQLQDELSDYLAEHARRESYALLSPPRVLFETDEDLDVGVFGIATRLVQTGPKGEVAVDAAPGATMLYKPAAPGLQPTEAASAVELGVQREVAVLIWGRAAPRGRETAGRDRPLEGRRRAGRRPERLPPARRIAPGGGCLLDRRPRLDERRRGERQTRQATEARRRHTVHRRLDRDQVRAGAAVAVLASAQVETTLLALKIAFLVLLYLFIWRIVRSAARDLRLPQESMILAPQQAAAAGLLAQPSARETGRLVVLHSPALDEGDLYTLDSHPMTIGRGATNDVPLREDEYSSTRHARLEPRRDGVWIEDIGSTNGTFVNGIRLTRERRLVPGDVVRIGETDLRFEP